MIPNTLSIAGVDPSGGAGVLADVKTMSALGAYGMAVIAALTAQNTRTVSGISPVPPDFVALQIDTLFADVRVDAVKIGMLGQQAVTRRVAERMAHWRPAHLVLDPVMVAKSGDHLLRRDAVGALRELLLPLALVVTPNIPEAEVLADMAIVTDEDRREAARRIASYGPRYVIVKGGHAPGDPVDYLYDGDQIIPIAAGPRIDTPNTHGTGCTFSSAITAGLAKGLGVEHAVRDAKTFITAALRRSYRVGAGHSPVNHFHAWWAGNEG